jgi:hypothetical protein
MAEMNEELQGRTVVILPGSGDDLRGSARTSAITAQARCLADAIVARLDCIDIFDDGGQLVLVAGGAPHNVNGQMLRKVLRENFVTKHLVMAGAGLGIEYRPVEVGELTIRNLLTAPPNQGGLLGRVPPLEIKDLRQEAAPVEPQATSPFPEIQAELESGAQQNARHAGGASGERTRLEVERGQQRLKELRNS